MKEINWNEVYAVVPEAISLSLNGRELRQGKDYEITDMAHTADMVVITCSAKPPLSGSRTVIMEIVNEDGQYFLQGSTEPLPGEIIRIADRLYTLQRGGKPVNKKTGTALNGFITKHDQIIYIADDLPPELEQEAFIHEILHGCIEMYTPLMRQQLSVDDEERFVTALARGIAETLARNPKYFAVKPQYTPLEMEIIRFDDKEVAEDANECDQ